MPVRWYRVPLLWFAMALLLLIIAACLHMVMFSFQYQDPALPDTGKQRVMGVPLSHVPADNDQPHE